MYEDSLLPAILFSTIALLLLLIATIIVFIAAHRQRVRQTVLLAETQVRYEQELRRIAAEVQEQLLANLSGELHSNIGQRLTLIHMQLQACEAATGNPPPLLNTAGLNLVEAMKQVRQLSHAYSADILTERGLFPMIAQEVGRLQQNGRLRVEFEADAAPDGLFLSPDQQLVAFRLFQEGVNNVLKHAAASMLRIRIGSGPFFLLEIIDDGTGFDPQSAGQPKGLGLSHMQRRAALANLQCSIVSTPGSGTICRIRQLNT